MPPGYLRQPSIVGNTVVFVAEDDLWSIDAGGGVARRLTASLSDATRPMLSADGKWIAYTSRDELHSEVWLMPAAGGAARRLTWLGATTQTRGWLPDGRVLFVSDASQPFAAEIHAYAVGIDGGPPERLPFGPAREVAFSSTGAVLLGRNTADPARWKRYRGGTAGQLWIDRNGSGSFRRLIELDGNLAGPMWIGGRAWFLSDHEGVGNLYSCRPDGRDLRCHTDHSEYYLRFPSTDGERIVYQHAADLWLLDPQTGSTGPIAVDLASPRAQRNRRFVPAEEFLSGHAVHPQGHSLAVETRGKLFSFPMWEEAVHQHGEPDGVRYRLPAWLGDGSALVTVSDQGGEDALEIHSADAEGPGRRLEGLDLGCIGEVAICPTSRIVAVANHRHELILVDLDAGTARMIERSPGAYLSDLAWSPDGRWLAYAAATGPSTIVIKVCEASSGHVHAVTRAEFLDHHPAWDPAGRYLYFLSNRVFDPVYDTVYFDLGFPRTGRPFATTLRRDVRSPFVPARKGIGGDPGEGKPSGNNGEAPEPVDIEFAGIEDRVVAFPSPIGDYVQIHALKDKVLFTTRPLEGALGHDIFADMPPANNAIEMYDLTSLRHEPLIPGVGSFVVSGDNTTMVYAVGRRLRAVKAGEKPSPDTDHEEPGRRSGWIDLGRVRVSVDPGTEWTQMLREAWRLQRDHFWVEDLSGVDWSRVLDRYLPLVDRVSSRFEFSDLMWEMQGELGTSHAYELGGDYRDPPQYAMGHLAADFSYDTRAARWTISHIVRGDSWEEGSDSPLHTPGAELSEGDTLLAISARILGRDVPPGRALVSQAGMAVELSVADGRGKRPRKVVVTTLRDERAPRYREWVSANRARVHEATKGRVGYVHVPDMQARGYSEFHRSYLAEVDRDALIIDVRFNGGGHVSQLILEKLARRRIGYAVQRWGPAAPYPEQSPAGPIVAITNEHAGSDGDIFTHCFKLFGLGPVVGKRTWGGVIGISPQHRLVDNSIVTQPEYSFWFSDVGWKVENYGTDPDYDVDIKPQDHAAGRDPQMEKAISLVSAALRKWRAPQPDLDKRPYLGGATSANGARRSEGTPSEATPKANGRRR